MAEPEIVLTAEKLGKRYVLGGLERLNDSFREMLIDLLLAPFRRFKKLSGKADESELFWALKDINFSIKRGEVVGIIGKNGAGKSTLLKILSRITTPTEGTVTIKGNVASLLEVGTGFHPELTGRENIYLNGAILGMKKKEISEKFDRIVEFANIEKFVDTPVKRYSSGMYVRLAFSIAAHLDPDILIVDEVLAVGDIHFQKKCLGKLEDISSQGRTVIFVSHNMASVLNLCNRGIVVDSGKVIYDAPIASAVKKYLALGSNSDGTGRVIFDNNQKPADLDNIFRKITLYDANHQVTSSFSVGDKMIVEIEVDMLKNFDDPQFSLGIDDELGVRIFTLSTYYSEYNSSSISGVYNVRCQLDELTLAPGDYKLTVCFGNSTNLVKYVKHNVMTIRVHDSNYFNNGRSYIKSSGPILQKSSWTEIR